MRVIRSSDYLNFAYERLAGETGPAVIFGSSLDVEDDHIWAAIDSNRRRATAVALRSKGKDIDREAARIRARLPHSHVFLLEAETHPFGSPDLRVRDIRLA